MKATSFHTNQPWYQCANRALSMLRLRQISTQSSLQLKMQVPKRSEDRPVITCTPIHGACGFNKPRCALDIVVNTLLSTFQQNPSFRVLAKQTKPHKYNCMLNYYSLAFFGLKKKKSGGLSMFSILLNNVGIYLSQKVGIISEFLSS